MGTDGQILTKIATGLGNFALLTWKVLREHSMLGEVT